MNRIIDLELDESGAWIASARGVRGCHTHGRSIGQALRRAREALAVCGVDARLADLEPVIHLPAAASAAARSYAAEREKLERQQASTRRSAAAAVEILTDVYGLSLRDAAEVLGLSHQRVHQLLSGPSAHAL